MELFSEANKGLIPTWSCLFPKAIYIRPLTGETINQKLCEVLKSANTRDPQVLHQTALFISIYFGKRVGET